MILRTRRGDGSCYWLLDWLDKVRIGLWLGFNMLHREEFQPKFRIDQRLGIKDRVAIISVDPQDGSKGFGLAGLDNQIFRTSQAGMFLRINNVRILSVSFDSVISRLAGMPYTEEMLVTSDDLDRNVAMTGSDGYRLKKDWKEFSVPGATVIAQASFWLGNCVDQELSRLYINTETVPRFWSIPKITKSKGLDQYVQTLLISNASGAFAYNAKRRQRLKFGRADDNSDFNFVKALYVIFWRHVMPLNPKRVIDSNGRKRRIILLGMLWLEKAVQIVLRLRQMGISDERTFGPMIDELQRVYRLREESVANLQGTCVEHAVP